MQKQHLSTNHKSHKKKNTYTISFSSLMPYSVFRLSKNTPLAIVKKNGQQTQSTGGWMRATEFPNPLACETGAQHKIFKDILGEKISSQIIEYLDKTTHEPVVLLFPHGIYVYDKFDGDYMSHLNHASRNDLNRQIKLREQLFERFSQELDKKIATQESLLENCK